MLWLAWDVFWDTVAYSNYLWEDYDGEGTRLPPTWKLTTIHVALCFKTFKFHLIPREVRKAKRLGGTVYEGN